MGTSAPQRDIGHRRLRLETLVRLRWLAVAGQTVAIVLVQGALGFPLPLAACLTLVGLSAWFNLVLRLRYPASLRLEPRIATLLLGYDVLQLAALLYLTGGLENPCRPRTRCASGCSWWPAPRCLAGCTCRCPGFREKP